jgi:hypothetical protein
MLPLALVPWNHGIHYPTVDESLDRLHRAGWLIGDTVFPVHAHALSGLQLLRAAGDDYRKDAVPPSLG